MTLESITIPPQTNKTPTHQIIMLHGWGANAQDLATLLPYLNLSDYQFIFPNAPFLYPYSPSGRAWYDLRSENMYKGLPEGREILTQWILSLEGSTEVPLSKTILGGFSQGGAMTLDVGLKLPVAGLVSMGGYWHDITNSDNDNKDFFAAPTLIMHGKQDSVVPLSAAIRACEAIKALGVEVQYEEFDAEHEINIEMLEVLRNFILKTLPPS
ncbi:phospholipase/carboxylesterase [Calothrix sp. NIES-4071]|nr:phospholipase/carboxylesterase [Calothrix sp. NIES-4071]BAZ60938.1 phospholipase/carboxylesterase [Calothrix sp. NIES-4105]